MNKGEEFAVSPGSRDISASAGPVRKSLHAADYVVFVLLLVFSLGIGVYYAVRGEGQNSTNEYLMGRRRLQLIPVSISMFMSYISAILILGNAAEMYKYGAQYFLAVWGGVFATFVSSYLFIPMIYRLKLVSSFQYLELRYKKPYVKRLGTTLSIIESIIYMGLAMYAPSTAMEAVTTLPAWISIIMLGIVVTLYTTVGGMRAVVWTDVLQGIVYMTGIVVILAMGAQKAGGLAEVFRVANEKGRLNIFPANSLNPDPTIRMTLWSLVVGRFFTALYMANRQANVQRFSALSSEKSAVLSVLLTIPAVIVAYTLTCLLGLVVFSYYAKTGCDPLRAGYIKNANQILPYFVINVLDTPGITGLLLAVLYSGALSSISSSLSSLSAVTWKDYLSERFGHLQESRKALITKIAVFIYGILGILVAFITQFLSGHVLMIASSFMGSIGGPRNSMFVMGALLPCANAIGAVTGVITGLAFGMWTAIGSNIANFHRSYLPTDVTNCSFAVNATVPPMPTNPTNVFPLYKISFLLHSVFATLIAMLIGTLVSFITGGSRGEKVEPSVMVPFVDKCCCCVPKSNREPCYCGISYDEEADEVKDGHDKKKEINEIDIKADNTKTQENGGLRTTSPRQRVAQLNQVYPCNSNGDVKAGEINQAFENTQL